MADTSSMKWLLDLGELAKYLQEAGPLWGEALQFRLGAGAKRIREKRKLRLLRAAVIMAAAAFEGWTNFLADKILADNRTAGRGLTEFEGDCLREKRKQLQNGDVHEQNCRFTSQERFLLLYKILNDDQRLNDGARTDLDRALKIRDRLIHPKPGNPVEMSELESAFGGFFRADVALAEAWVKAKSNRTPRPVLVHS